MIKKPYRARRTFSLLLLLLLLVNILPIQGMAADQVYEGEITLTGKTANSQFSLDGSDIEMFNLENIAPGDQWKGKIHVKNSTYADMEISILSIVSNLQDNTLYDALDLDISLAGDSIYSGSYGATAEPISAPHRINGQDSITFDITVTLPKTAGNEIMDKKMDSTWTFEANYYGHFGFRVDYSVHYVDEDGNTLLESKESSGFFGTAVLEKAPDIEGYTPDAQEKRLLLTYGKNEIIFVYSPDTSDTPADPTDPTEPITPDQPTNPETPVEPNEPTDPEKPTDPTTPEKPEGPIDSGDGKPSEKDNVSTGYDLTEGNTDTTVWLMVLGLSAAAAVIIIFRIKREQKRIRNTKRKEDPTDAEK